MRPRRRASLKRTAADHSPASWIGADRPQETRFRIDTVSLRGVDIQPFFGANAPSEHDRLPAGADERPEGSIRTSSRFWTPSRGTREIFTDELLSRGLPGVPPCSSL